MRAVTNAPPLGLALFAPAALLALAASWGAIGTIAALVPVPDSGHASDAFVFHEAARATLAGEAATLFDPEAFAARSEHFGTLRWLYPPTMLLLIAPLGLVPYAAAKIAILFASFGALALAARLALGPGQRLPTALLLLSPAAFVLALVAQLEGVFVLLAVIGVTQARARPLIAGAALALLTVKPQLGLLLPFALIGLGAWRAVAAAALGAMLLVLASILAFGAEPWLVMASHLGEHQLGHGLEVAPGNMGAYQSLRKLGLPAATAATLYLALCAAAALAAFRLARARAAALLPFVLLATSVICPVTWPYQWLGATLGALMLTGRAPGLSADGWLGAVVALGGLPSMILGGAATLPVTGAAALLAARLAGRGRSSGQRAQSEGGTTNSSRIIATVSGSTGFGITRRSGKALATAPVSGP